jgi:hypothetical protein
VTLQDVQLKYQGGVLTTPSQIAAATPTAPTSLTTKAYVDAAVGNVPSVALPSDVGLKAWAYDPAALSTGQAITSGVIYLNGVYVHSATTASNLVYAQTTAGTGPTAGANWIGLYNASGTLLATTALDAVLTSVGIKSVAITPQAVTVGLYWVALLQNATSQQAGAQNSVGGFQSLAALGLTTGATARYAVNGTGATTLPATITPANNSNPTTGTTAKYFWVGLA